MWGDIIMVKPAACWDPAAAADDGISPVADLLPWSLQVSKTVEGPQSALPPPERPFPFLQAFKW